MTGTPIDAREAMTPDPVAPPRQRRRWLRPALFGLLLLAGLGLLILWFSRTAIVERLVRDELDKRGVRGNFEVDDIGLRQQVIRNLVLGDPANPDLRVERLQIGLGLSGLTPKIHWIMASGVRLNAKFRGGHFSMGELDKFLDPESTEPTRLPEFWVTLRDGQMRLDSDYGLLSVRLEGEGRLHDGFRGRYGASSEMLTVGGCAIRSIAATGEVSTRAGRTALRGPITMVDTGCADEQWAASDVRAAIDLALARDFTGWAGQLALAEAKLTGPSLSALAAPSVLGFVGNAQQMTGQTDLALANLSLPGGRAKQMTLRGPWRLALGGKSSASGWQGAVQLRDVALDAPDAASLEAINTDFRDSPVGAIVAQLTAAVGRARQNFAARAQLAVELSGEGPRIALDALSANAPGGGQLRLEAPVQLTQRGAEWRLDRDPVLRLSGGQLPDARLTLAQGSLSGAPAGVLQLSPYRAGADSLALPRLEFAPAAGGGFAISGILEFTGPLPDGRVSGLRLPVAGTVGSDGSYRLFSRCVPVSVDSLTLAQFAFARTSVTLCPQGGAILASGPGGTPRFVTRVAPLDLVGRMGSTPFFLKAASARFDLANGLDAQQVDLRFGAPAPPPKVLAAPVSTELDDGSPASSPLAAQSVEQVDLSQTRFAAEQLTATFLGKGGDIGGMIIGGQVHIAKVPLLLGDISGDWAYTAGVLTAQPALSIADAQQVDRFNPLLAKKTGLTLADNVLRASGQLVEPSTGRTVSDVAITHDLVSSTGSADLLIESLTFDDKLQPELLTPLTLGVVANVAGTASGFGRIDWNPEKLTSTGSFATEAMDLAALFGPVERLSGTIRFADLLNLVTEPNQQVALGVINPGVAVYDGVVRYRLLDGFRVELQGGRWPFAGGELVLQPTILDFGEASERRLVFDVIGIDAAEFILLMELDNLAATGTFDGRLPMVFNAQGGRIEDGFLRARPAGGSVSYVGELSYEDLSLYGNYAFNMLRSLKYRELRIDMNGEIDGEIISNVRFGGLQQGDDVKQGLIAGIIARQIRDLPIQFNVAIKAPFFQLFQSFNSLYDAEYSARINFPQLQAARAAEAKAEAEAQAAVRNNSKAEPEASKPIQPSESETVP